MAGRKQHHIPQFLLRGFETESTGRKCQVRVFSKSKTFTAPIDDVAAERHFYSELVADGSKTVDDLITAYENSLADKLAELRSVPNGEETDSGVAAEVAAHLTIRNAHLRRSISGAFQMLARQAADLFCKEGALRELLGMDSLSAPTRTSSAIEDLIEQDPRFAASGLPRDVIHRLAFMAMRENFAAFNAQHSPMFEVFFDRLLMDIPAHMRSGHNRALSGGLAPDGRASALKKLRWTVHDAPEGGLVLPDCVAIGIDAEGRPHPLVMTDFDKLRFALMPLSSNKLLVGAAETDRVFQEAQDFNEMAAGCSHDFFVAHRKGADFDRLVATIGSRTQQAIEDVVGQAFEGFKKERLPQQASDDSRVEATEAEPPPAVSSLNFEMKFRGVADQATAEHIAGVVSAIVRELRPVMALDRLEGFTFASDYEAALQELDTGFELGTPLRPTKDAHAVGVAMTPLVLRDGVVKSRIVTELWLAEGLISDDDERQKVSMHTLVSQMAHVACVQLLDEALPGVHTQAIEDSLDGLLYPCVSSAWTGYFAARASAIFRPDAGAMCSELAVGALQRAKLSIPAARLEYYQDHNMDKLMAVVIPAITAILSHIGRSIGHNDGLLEEAENETTLSIIREMPDLEAWMAVFQNDLARIWFRRGQWESVAELLAMTRHAERLFWQFGLIPWKLDDGRVWIQVSNEPPATQ